MKAPERFDRVVITSELSVTRYGNGCIIAPGFRMARFKPICPGAAFVVKCLRILRYSRNAGLVFHISDLI